MSDELRPLPIGSQITTYIVFGWWPDGEEIQDPHEEEATALDAARMCEEGGALGVYVQLRIERVVPEVVSIETIYGEESV